MVNKEATTTGVTLWEGPRDWQIIQRDHLGCGLIVLKGTWLTTEKECSVQARIVRESDQLPVTSELDWQTAEMDSALKQFSIVLNNIPQGGLYRVETRLRRYTSNDRRALRGDCIHHIGVGDLYLIAGQSNASGTGKGGAEDGPQLGVHVFANDEQWKLASHPLEDATDTLHPITVTGVFHGHSPWIAFAKTLQARTNLPIGLIPTALGGSPMSMWMSKEKGRGKLFDNMADMLDKAGGKAAGVLWYQGESDIYLNLLDDYKQAFRQFVDEVRILTNNPTLPVLTAQLNAHISVDALDAGWSRIRELQRELSKELDHVYLIVTIDCNLSDEIHNSSLSNVVIGQRFAAVALEHIYAYPCSSAHPDFTEASFVDDDKSLIMLRFAQVGGDWTRYDVTSDFRVEDQTGAIALKSVKLGEEGVVWLSLERASQGATTITGLYGANPKPTLLDDNGRCIVPFIGTIK